MKPLNFLKLNLAFLVLMAYSDARAGDVSSSARYPEAPLADVMSKEDIEQKKAEELEAKAAEQRDQYEKHKRDVEQQISAHKYNIEGLKMRQEKAQSEIEELNTALQDVNGRIEGLSSQSAKLEEDTQRTVEYLDSLRAELGNRQKLLSDKMVALQRARQESENVIYMKSVEVQRMKNEMAQAETKVADAEALRADLEAEEMKTRTTWMQTKLNISDKMHQKDESIAQAREAKEKHDRAVADLNVARAELAKAEKARAETAAKTSAEVARYESEMINASKSRVAAESERIRLETEANKLRDYASRIKSNRDQSVSESQDAGSMVLRTKVAVETARTELATAMQADDQSASKRKKSEAQERGLASAKEAADLFAGARRWVTTSKCRAYAKPKESGPSEQYSSGSRVMAREYSNPDWVEVVTGSGVSAYLKQTCGHFEDR